MYRTYECQHTQCVWENNGVVSRWKSNTKTARNVRANHQRKKQFHPCCKEEDMCATGKRIRGGMEEPPRKRPFQCKHTGCSKEFSSLSSRSTHHKNANLHKNCENCSMCDKHNFNTPTDVEEFPPEPVDSNTLVTKMEEIVAGVAVGELNFQPSTEPLPVNALGDAIVISRTLNPGILRVSRFSDAFASTHESLVDLLKDTGIPCDKHTETIKILSQRNDNLQRLLTASSTDASRAILTEEPTLVTSQSPTL